MPSLQPVLVPCKGADVDLTLSYDPREPSHLHLYWGTALLQLVPRDSNSLLFRVTAGLLSGLGLKMSSLEACLGITAKTLRKWGKALREGDWEGIAPVFHGPGAEPKLRPDIERYVRVRYRDALAEANSVSVPYGFRLELAARIEHIWDVTVSGESLRRVFREEDAQWELEQSSARDREVTGTEAPTDGPSADETPAGDAIDSTPCSAGALCASTSVETAVEDGCPVDAVDTRIKHGTTSVPADMREEGCASAPLSSTESGRSSNLPPESSARTPSAMPLLGGSLPGGPSISQHAGLFLLAPWFEQAFGSSPPIVRQTAAQILLGAVNQEQSKHIDYGGLSLLTDSPVRDIDHQHTLLGRLPDVQTRMDVYAANARLLNLSRQRIFYVDPHHKEYTGIEKILFAWSGKHHDVRKGILMDFIHTESGHPCFIGHYDNYYDARERFVMLIADFRKLFPADAGNFLWIHDRGYWSRDFLDLIAENGDRYIQWEKGYKVGAWDLPPTRSGGFTIRRKRNNRDDTIPVRVEWHELPWGDHPGARRLILRIRRPGGDEIEVAIVTNDTSLSPEQIIQLMLNRWLQESDFAYLGRHFGINELGGRNVESYAQLVNELEDRDVESREHKRAIKTRDKLRRQLGTELIALRGLPPISLHDLQKERSRLRDELDELGRELGAVKVLEDPSEQLPELAKRVGTLHERLAFWHGRKKEAQKRIEAENRVASIEQEMAGIQEQLAQINRTESRLLALIEERFVRPDMRKKAILDAIRITCRNVFRSALDIFRPIYNDYRDDHDILRQLTRSSGVLIERHERIAIHLTAALHRQPAQWQRIRSFLDICANRIRQASGREMAFTVERTNRQIFAEVTRVLSRTR